jgi:uncharacterized protein (DUF2237 family)
MLYIITRAGNSADSYPVRFYKRYGSHVCVGHIHPAGSMAGLQLVNICAVVQARSDPMKYVACEATHGNWVSRSIDPLWIRKRRPGVYISLDTQKRQEALDAQKKMLVNNVLVVL